MKGARLGPSYSDAEIAALLDALEAVYSSLPREALLERVAELLADEQVVGWFNGRMEFGPRALGARSILGDPRSPRMQAEMNLKIKFREGFRPFAPSVLSERAAEWLDIDCESPYMLLVAPVRAEKRLPMTDEQQSLWGLDLLNQQRSTIPAVTHVDYSARIQTVNRDVSPDYYDLIAAFERRTGCPVLINTSFNVRGEPIVCSPRDAYTCFMRTNIDVLVLGSHLLVKREQPAREDDAQWMQEFQLD